MSDTSDNSLDDLTILRDRTLAKILDVSLVTVWRMRERGDLTPKVQISKGVSGTRLSAVRSLIEQGSKR